MATEVQSNQMDSEATVAVQIQEKLPTKKKGWKKFFNFFTSEKSKSKEVTPKIKKDPKTPKPKKSSKSKIHQVKSEGEIILNSEVVPITEEVEEKRKRLSLKWIFKSRDSSKNAEKSTDKIFSTQTYVKVYDDLKEWPENVNEAGEPASEAGDNMKTELEAEEQSELVFEVAKEAEAVDDSKNELEGKSQPDLDISESSSKDDSDAFKTHISASLVSASIVALSICPSTFDAIEYNMPDIELSQVDEIKKRGSLRRFIKNPFGRRNPSKMKLSSKTIIETVDDDEFEDISILDDTYKEHQILNIKDTPLVDGYFDVLSSVQEEMDKGDQIIETKDKPAVNEDADALIPIVEEVAKGNQVIQIEDKQAVDENCDDKILTEDHSTDCQIDQGEHQLESEVIQTTSEINNKELEMISIKSEEINAQDLNDSSNTQKEAEITKQTTSQDAETTSKITDNIETKLVYTESELMIGIGPCSSPVKSIKIESDSKIPTILKNPRKSGIPHRRRVKNLRFNLPIIEEENEDENTNETPNVFDALMADLKMSQNIPKLSMIFFEESKTQLKSKDATIMTVKSVTDEDKNVNELPIIGDCSNVTQKIDKNEPLNCEEISHDNSSHKKLDASVAEALKK